MKLARCGLMAVALLLFASVFAQTKPCEELKSEIEAKLKQKGVTNYTLEIVPADQIKDQKVVGSCDAGKNKITYTKEAKGAKDAKDTKDKDKK
jgi:hypothetical protein